MSGFGSAFGGGGGFGGNGWDDPFDGVDGGSGQSNEEKYGPRKFWMPAGATKRVMFVDGSPFALYEHGLYAVNKSKDNVTCLKKNGMDDGKGCPLCENELWPSFVGYFTVIDCGDVARRADGTVKLSGFTGKTGKVYQFQKSLLGAKRGGKDKPGVLQKLRRLASKHGDSLAGTVWDVYRSGAKVESVGDEWEFVEKVKPSDYGSYLAGLGAQGDVDLKQFDYAKVFAPKPYDDLRRLVGDKKKASDDDLEY